MTKKDFELIAETLQRSRDAYADQDVEVDGAFSQWNWTVECFADACASSNPRFDRERFVRACQPGANVRARS